MAPLEPYLCVSGNEVANAERTAAYIAWSGQAVVTMGTCSDCLADGETFTDPATDDAPWYDPANDASAEFLGVLPTLVDLVGTGGRGTVATSDGDLLGPYRRGGLRVEVEGLLWASSRRGMAYGERWLREAVDDGFGLGDATVIPACGPAPAIVPPPVTEPYAIGDSQFALHGAEVEAAIPGLEVEGFAPAGGAATDHPLVVAAIADRLALGNPEWVLTDLGGNNVLQGRTDHFDRMDDFIQLFPSSVPIYWLNLHPKTDLPTPTGFTEAAAGRPTGWNAILDFTAVYPNVHIIDYDAFADAQPGTFWQDNVHISNAGAPVWAAWLATQLPGGGGAASLAHLLRSPSGSLLRGPGVLVRGYGTSASSPAAPVTTPVPPSDLLWRTMHRVGLIDGPVFGRVGNQSDAIVRSVSFQLASEVPWLSGVPVIAAQASVTASGLHRVVTTNQWVADTSVVVSLEAGSSGSAGPFHISVAPSPDGSCPGGLPPCLDIDVDVLPAGSVFVIDTAARRVDFWDPRRKAIVPGWDYIANPEAFAWPEVPHCSTFCVSVTRGVGYDDNAETRAVIAAAAREYP